MGAQWEIDTISSRYGQAWPEAPQPPAQHSPWPASHLVASHQHPGFKQKTLSRTQIPHVSWVCLRKSTVVDRHCPASVAIWWYFLMGHVLPMILNQIWVTLIAEDVGGKNLGPRVLGWESKTPDHGPTRPTRPEGSHVSWNDSTPTYHPF